ncbi:16S rRNA (cytosine(967)-C(5))-methyltransferase RsmB [Intestinimonas sp.]|uniref:16S rRNA (cytosine(967)-C(5))-methyltransferase RsmB n=1 Tax=Intestinimonas sp. TaxID=1965293 RepID=UPI00263171E2|nr:16S rRNA (cytosine(967)-C(5))-methyltransferase RsmB [Intestinimonas sp.]
MAGNAREVALLTLSACERQGAWSDLSLKKNIRTAGLDSRDAALATRLCFGVLQNRMLLDFYIGKFSTVRTERMENKVLNALRLGAYQMAFLTRVPVSAAVNESVDLVKRHSKNPRSPGLVNGILRSMGRNIDRLPTIPAEDPVSYLSVRYSHPAWLVEAFLERLGPAETEELLAADNGEPPTVAQVNRLWGDLEKAAASLRSEGAEAEPHPWLPDCLTLVGGGDLEQRTVFREGGIYIQDAGARLAVLAAGAKPGMAVLDACAAPGGKSFAAAMEMGDAGKLISCDIHAHKKTLIDAGAKRLGLTCLTSVVQDGKAHRAEWEGAFDLVMADVPCSGLGIIRKKPDIRYKDPAPLAGLPAVQSAILENVSTYVKPGGVLLYCTCTLQKCENEDVVTAFLSAHPEYALEGFGLPGPVGEVLGGMVTLWPQRHGTDGFFFAKLRRRGG